MKYHMVKYNSSGNIYLIEERPDGLLIVVDRIFIKDEARSCSIGHRMILLELNRDDIELQSGGEEIIALAALEKL